jgi:hypothetical protein
MQKLTIFFFHARDSTKATPAGKCDQWISNENIPVRTGMFRRQVFGFWKVVGLA